MHTTISDLPLRTAVRSQQAMWALGGPTAESARDRLHALHDDERGAQAAEYAMLGGVSAAACGGLIAILSDSGILKKLVQAVVSALINAVGSWF